MIDGMTQIEALTPASLRAMAQRIMQSTEAEHFVYRETEMDELWRLAKAGLHAAPLAGRDDLRRVRDLIEHAHDTLANSENKSTAAASLISAAAMLG